MTTFVRRCLSGIVNNNVKSVSHVQLVKLKKVNKGFSLSKRNLSSTQSDCNLQQSNKNFGLPETIPSKSDVCIIGGGAMGSSTAFWLKQNEAGKDMKVVVIERDPKYTKASTVLSLGGVRQQFSLQENIQLSMFGADFLRRADEFLGVKGQPPTDVQYYPCGYLFLTSTHEGAQLLHENWTLQKQLGSKVELLSKEKLKKKFPFLNVDDIQLGSHGLDNEGRFDPWSLLNGFKRKAISLGATYVTGEVTDFDFKTRPGEPDCSPNAVMVTTPEGKINVIEFNHCVLASGYESGRVASLVGIGGGKGLLSCPLPVEPRKRYVYFVHAPNVPADGFPTLIDSTGAHATREGSPKHFVCGISPSEEDEPPTDNLDVDFSFFDSHVWPNLAHRVPTMNNLKVKSAWAGYYDFNTFDQNGVIGTHPVFKNLHFATGFSGHGIQQSPAVGRALMELIIHNRYLTIDLDNFGFERFINGKKVLEQNIV